MDVVTVVTTVVNEADAVTTAVVAVMVDVPDGLVACRLHAALRTIAG